MRCSMTRLFLLIVALTVATLSFACTSFCIHTKDQLVFGKNFDFDTGVGHVQVNKRGVVKTSFLLPPERKFQWTSKYGSITFNQMGREFPYGGINEKGLVIEIMWLAFAEYPNIDDRYGLTELQWIQYQLDNSLTVAEVLASDKTLRISQKSKAPVHFMVVDAKGNKATIEYIGGRFVVHTGSDLTPCVLTNNTYEQSANHLGALIQKGETGKGPFRTSSLDRFAEASFLLKNYKSGGAVDYAFDILNKTFQPNFTRWSIVYDIKNMKVYYTTLDNSDVRRLSLNEFNFACDAPSLYIDIEEGMQGKKVEFKPYSPEENDKLVTKAFSRVDFLLGVSKYERELVSRYPETVQCK